MAHTAAMAAEAAAGPKPSPAAIREAPRRHRTGVSPRQPLRRTNESCEEYPAGLPPSDDVAAGSLRLLTSGARLIPSRAPGGGPAPMDLPPSRSHGFGHAHGRSHVLPVETRLLRPCMLPDRRRPTNGSSRNSKPAAATLTSRAAHTRCTPPSQDTRGTITLNLLGAHVHLDGEHDDEFRNIIASAWARYHRKNSSGEPEVPRNTSNRHLK